MNKDQKRLLNYSYDLLARQRYTIKQMMNKLDKYNQKLEKPLNETELAEIINSLIQSNFLNDYDYTMFYIDNQLRRKPQGVRALKHSLFLKGIDPEIIEQQIDQAEIDEFELAQRALEKKLKYTDSTNHQAKLVRFLASRGFPSSIIYKSINQNLYNQ